MRDHQAFLAQLNPPRRSCKNTLIFDIIEFHRDVDGAKKLEEMGIHAKKEGVQSFSEGGTSKPGSTDRFINIRIIYVSSLILFFWNVFFMYDPVFRDLFMLE